MSFKEIHASRVKAMLQIPLRFAGNQLPSINQHNMITWTTFSPLLSSTKAAFQANFLLEKKLRSRSILNSSTSNLKFIGLKADTALRLKFKLLPAKPADVGSA